MWSKKELEYDKQDWYQRVKHTEREVDQQAHHQQRTGTQPGRGMFMAVGISQKSENGLCVWWGGVGGAGTSRGRNGVTRAFWELLEARLGRAAAPSPAGQGPDPSLPSRGVPGSPVFPSLAEPGQREGSLGVQPRVREADPAPSELRYLRQLPHTSVEQTLRLPGEETELTHQVSETCWG